MVDKSVLDFYVSLYGLFPRVPLKGIPRLSALISFKLCLVLWVILAFLPVVKRLNSRCITRNSSENCLLLEIFYYFYFR